MYYCQTQKTVNKNDILEGYQISMKKPIRCEKAKSLTSSNNYIDTPINSIKFALVIGHLGIWN